MFICYNYNANIYHIFEYCIFMYPQKLMHVHVRYEISIRYVMLQVYEPVVK